jgi:hypothetical protein
MRRSALGVFLMLSAPLGWQKGALLFMYYYCIKLVFIVRTKLFFWRSCDPGVILVNNNNDLFLPDSQTRERVVKNRRAKIKKKKTS